MAILPTGQTYALNADRYQIYPASPYGPFILGKALQSQEFSFDIPNEVVLEIGNEEQRGVSIQSAEFKGTLQSLLVDTDLIQIYTSKMGSVVQPVDTVGTSISGGSNTISQVVSPVNYVSGITSVTYTLEVTSEDKIKISGISDVEYETDTVINPIAGVELVVLNSGLLVVGDQAELAVTKENLWNASDFKSAEVDFLVVARDNSTSDSVFKCDYAQGMIAQSTSVESSSDGNALISFENEGNTYVSHQGYVYRKAAYANAADVVNGYLDLDDKGLLAGAESPHIGGNGGKYSGHFFLKATRTLLDGTQAAMVEKSANAQDLDFTYVDATHVATPYAASMTLGDRYEFTFFCLVSGTSFDIDFTDTTSPDNVDGRYVPVYYGNEKLETVASSNISMAFSRERKSRQGYVDDYFTPSKVPAITGDIASMDGDLKLVKLLTKGDVDTTEVQFDYNEHGTYTNINDISHYIQILDPSDGVSEVATFTITKMQIISSSIPIAVGSDTGRSFSWTAKNGACAIKRS